MPDPFERHARPGRWDWDSGGPSRRQQRDAAVADQTDPSPATPRSRKRGPDRCKPNHGGPHSPVLGMSSWSVQAGRRCGWKLSWRAGADGRREVVFYCHHIRVCSACGKVLDTSLDPGECPSWPADEEHAKVNAEADAEAAAEPRPGRHRRRVITGPAHYRKPKGRKPSG